MSVKINHCKAETEDMETIRITILPQASHFTLYMFANYLWSFLSAYSNMGCILHDSVLRNAEIWRPGSWLTPRRSKSQSSGSNQDFGQGTQPHAFCGVCLKYTTLVNTSSVNLLLRTMLTDIKTLWLLVKHLLCFSCYCKWVNQISVFGWFPSLYPNYPFNSVSLKDPISMLIFYAFNYDK